MTAGIPSSDSSDSLRQQQIALRLWEYVHRTSTQFTRELALDVTRSVLLLPDHQPKVLARHLRKELHRRGVEVKHTSALKAAALLLGHQGWHGCARNDPKHVLLSLLGDLREESFASWRELASRLWVCCDAWQREHSTKVFELHFGTRFVAIEASRVPIAVIYPVGPAAAWIRDAPAALETLRRRLEEPRKAVLGGVAVLQLCDRYLLAGTPEIPELMLPSASFEAELVLLRQDNPLLPSSAHEIARGDEVTCWSHLDQVILRGNDEVKLDKASWRIGAGRYVWQLTMIRPCDAVPGKTIRTLGEEDVRKLLRRYRLSKDILSGVAIRRVPAGKLSHVRHPADPYRINLDQLLVHMRAAGLTWEQHCADVGVHVEMTPELPMDFVFSLLKRLRLRDPNVVLVQPARADLSAVMDDSLLRVLIPRVDDLRYRIPDDFPAELASTVSDAIADLRVSMHAEWAPVRRSLTEADPPPPAMCAEDGRDLRLSLERHGLIMFAGVMPYIRWRVEEADEDMAVRHPFVLRHSLLLDIDFKEGARW